MSPKLSNSTPVKGTDGDWREIHENERLNFDVMESFINSYEYQLKFVIADRKDLQEVEQILASLCEHSRDRVLLMPEGTDRDTLCKRRRWISEVCKDRGFRYSPRLQIHIYGNERGT